MSEHEEEAAQQKQKVVVKSVQKTTKIDFINNLFGVF
jgi:hypothetical protein